MPETVKNNQLTLLDIATFYLEHPELGKNIFVTKIVNNREDIVTYTCPHAWSFVDVVHIINRCSNTCITCEKCWDTIAIDIPDDYIAYMQKTEGDK